MTIDTVILWLQNFSNINLEKKKKLIHMVFYLKIKEFTSIVVIIYYSIRIIVIVIFKYLIIINNTVVEMIISSLATSCFPFFIIISLPIIYEIHKYGRIILNYTNCRIS